MGEFLSNEPVPAWGRLLRHAEGNLEPEFGGIRRREFIQAPVREYRRPLGMKYFRDCKPQGSYRWETFVFNLVLGLLLDCQPEGMKLGIISGGPSWDL